VLLAADFSFVLGTRLIQLEPAVPGSLRQTPFVARSLTRARGTEPAGDPAGVSAKARRSID